MELNYNVFIFLIFFGSSGSSEVTVYTAVFVVFFCEGVKF